MTADRHDIETGTDIVPVACTLASADLAAQAGRWARLAARAMTERAETADGLSLRFRGDVEFEAELRHLVAVETDCCRWASWAVRETDGQLVLEVRATGDGVTVLHAMFAGPYPAPAGG